MRSFIGRSATKRSATGDQCEAILPRIGRLYNCLYRYKAGYQLNTYAVFQKIEGSVMGFARQAVNGMLGDPQHWVNTTIIDMVRSMEERSAGTRETETRPSESRIHAPD